jgi:hypothetical protein
MKNTLRGNVDFVSRYPPFGRSSGMRGEASSLFRQPASEFAVLINRKNRVLRAPATTDTCNLSAGDPEGSPFAFWDPFRRDRVLRLPATTFP